jgi:hypothetical protein
MQALIESADKDKMWRALERLIGVRLEAAPVPCVTTATETKDAEIE